MPEVHDLEIMNSFNIRSVGLLLAYDSAEQKRGYVPKPGDFVRSCSRGTVYYINKVEVLYDEKFLEPSFRFQNAELAGLEEFMKRRHCDTHMLAHVETLTECLIEYACPGEEYLEDTQLTVNQLIATVLECQQRVFLLEKKVEELHAERDTKNKAAES